MLIYGRNTVLQALESLYPISDLYLEENISRDTKIQSIISIAEDKDIKINFINRSNLSNLTKSKEHQGVASTIQFSTYKITDILANLTNQAKLIYITEATYEHNVGAIIRTSECLGLDGVILTPEINITPTICKISTGAIFHIPIIKLGVYQTIKELKKVGFNIFGIERGGEVYYSADLTGNALFIIGGEDKSLTDNLIERCDKVLEIPQHGNTNSLNMSVASSIVLSESIRQSTLKLS